MPANLTPQYLEVEKRFREAKGTEEKLAALQEMLAVIPKHKGTEHLRGDLKRRLAKLKDDAEQARRRKGGFSISVDSEGAGQVVLVGPPNSGKSALVAILSKAPTEVGEYPFTTRLPAPFMMPFETTQIQLIDTPPVTGEIMETWFPEMVKMADAVLLVADLADPDTAGQLDNVRRRLRERKVDLVGTATDIPPERFPFLKRTVLAANKVDAEGAMKAFEDLSVLLEGPFERIPVSATTGRGLETLHRAIFGLLHVVRVYSKIPGKKAERASTFALKRGS
ncbi:MAG: GTPase, partial [candidate division NC10 bacterium]